MELKTEIIKLCKEDSNFRSELKYLLDIDDIETELEYQKNSLKMNKST